MSINALTTEIISVSGIYFKNTLKNNGSKTNLNSGGFLKSDTLMTKDDTEKNITKIIKNIKKCKTCGVLILIQINKTSL